MTLLALSGVHHAYRQGGIFGRRPWRMVLRDAALRIDSGECVALLGPTGSGKSTLGRLVLGLERPQRGSILFEGAPLTDAGGRMAAATRQAIQAVFQDPQAATSPRFTGYEVVAEPLHVLGQASRDRVATLLAEVDLPEALLDRPAHRMSGGQLQRLCIARALATRPRLVVLDEAVNSLDLETQATVMALLRRLRRQHGMAFLFITHDLRLLRGFADRSYVMQDQQPLAVDDPFGPGPHPPMLQALREAILPEWPRALRERKRSA